MFSTESFLVIIPKDSKLSKWIHLSILSSGHPDLRNLYSNYMDNGFRCPKLA